jgi:hypothetical protein
MTPSRLPLRAAFLHVIHSPPTKTRDWMSSSTSTTLMPNAAILRDLQLRSPDSIRKDSGPKAISDLLRTDREAYTCAVVVLAVCERVGLCSGLPLYIIFFRMFAIRKNNISPTVHVVIVGNRPDNHCETVLRDDRDSICDTKEN